MSNSDRLKHKAKLQSSVSPVVLEQPADLSTPASLRSSLLISSSFSLSPTQESGFNVVSHSENNNHNINQRESISNANVLDPNLSFLYYLETAEQIKDQHEFVERQISSHLGELDTSMSALKCLNDNTPISDSWHNVEKNELFENKVKFNFNSGHYKNNNNNNNVGILSSTDTSSEEESQRELSIPSLLTVSNLNEERVLSHIVSHQEMSFSAASLPHPTNVVNISDNNIQDIIIDEDLNLNNIVTKSLSSSSNSFIMPKLSFKNETSSLTLKFNKRYDKKHYILILGRHGLHFFKSIPMEYQQFFQLPTSHNPKDFEQYHGLIIIVKELRELITLLNRVSKLDGGGPPLIVLYHNDQRVQVKNIIKSFLRKQLISLYYPPIDINNEEELNNLFHVIKLSLTNEKQTEINLEEIQSLNGQDSYDLSLSSALPSSFESQDNFNNGLKKRRKRKRQGPEEITRRANISKKEKNRSTNNNISKKGIKNERKQWFDYIFTKWIIWGVSISAGISAAYYIKHSYNINKDTFPFIRVILDAEFFKKLKKTLLTKIVGSLFPTTEPQCMEQQEYPITSASISNTNSTSVRDTLKPVLNYCFNFIKYPLIKVNNFIRNTIVATKKCYTVSLEKLSKIDNWNVDDSNNFITLSYITI